MQHTKRTHLAGTIWDMGDMAEFGALIKSARDRRGLTQTALGTRIGYSPNFVNRIESGSMTNPPSPQTMRELERELGVSRQAMLVSMGYLDEAQDHEGDAIIVPATDPRAELLRVLDGEPDAGIRKVIELARLVLDLTDNHVAQSVHTSDAHDTGERAS